MSKLILALVILAVPASAMAQSFTWYDDRPAWDAARAAGGYTTLWGMEDFEQSTLPPGQWVVINDPLATGVPSGPFPAGLVHPALTVQSNMDWTGRLFPNPRGQDGLGVVSAGYTYPGYYPVDSASAFVVSAFMYDSLDVIFGPGTVNAAGFAPITGVQGDMFVRAFGLNNELLAERIIPMADWTGAYFVGVVSDTPIARINLYTLTGGYAYEGLDNLSTYVTAQSFTWYDDRPAWDAARAAGGYTTLRGTENYEESTLGPGQGVPVDDPLQTGVPSPYFPVGLVGHPGLTVQSNADFTGTLFPNPGEGLLLVSAGYTLGEGAAVSDFVVSRAIFGNSHDVVFGPDDMVNAAGFTPISSRPGAMLVRAFGLNNVLLAETTILGNWTGDFFAGVVSDTPIARINMYTLTGWYAYEGLDNLSTYVYEGMIGACCLPDGACLPDTSEAACLAQSGLWQGAGSTCVPNPCVADCNGNGISDSQDIAGGTSEDCNANLVPDECDIAVGTSRDCQPNSTPDECDIIGGTSLDADGDGIPDECEAEAGACCDPLTAACTMVTAADCVAAGGVFQGVNTTCIPPYPDPYPCVPVNDLCTNAVVIDSLPFSTTVNNDSATADEPPGIAPPGAPPGSCNSQSAYDMENSVWYKWTAAEDCRGTMIVNPDVNSPGYNGTVAVYSGPDCSTLEQVACGNDPEPIVATFDATAGTAYWFQIGDWGVVEGGGLTDINFDCVAVPGACCSQPDACAELTEAQCNALGWNFRGVGTQCPTQDVQTAVHQGQSVVHWSVPGLNCYEIGGGGRGVDCVPHPQGIKIDAWSTAPNGLTCQQFGTPESPAIPPGFFEPGAEPFEGQICFRGEPLGDTPWGFYDVADTLIQRTEDPWDRCVLPGPQEQSVAIQILALSLRSVAPIVVGGPSGETSWDTAVDLSAVPSPLGWITARKTHCNGGIYTSVLPVQPRYTFTRVDDPQQVRELDTGLEELPPMQIVQSANPPWVSETDFAVQSPWCTDFHPNIADPQPTLACDCNGNDVRDLCDIASGTSRDCNNNRIPDECDLAAGTSADCQPNGMPDECDSAIPTWFTSCEHLFKFYNGTIPSGFYDLSPDGDTIISAYCHMTAEHGWTVVDPSVDPDWSRFFTVWSPFAGGRVYGNPDSCSSWREWFILADNDTRFATSPDGRSIEMLDTVYRMTGNYYGCSWCNHHCDFDDISCRWCYDGVNPFPTPGTCPWLTGSHLQQHDADYSYCLSCYWDCWNTAPSIGADGTHCIAYWSPISAPSDCNFNSIPDECDLLSGFSSDCNANAIPDECDIANEISLDANGNGVPDECQGDGDCDGDGDVDLGDFGQQFACFMGPGTPAGVGCACVNFDGDADVDLADFAAFSTAFTGPR